MSRLFTDSDLLTWEAYVSTDPFGLPERPKIVFNCLSDAGRPARFVEGENGDAADAQRHLIELSDGALKSLLDESQELD